MVAAVESALEVAFRDDPAAPRTTPWFAVPAIAHRRAAAARAASLPLWRAGGAVAAGRCLLVRRRAARGVRAGTYAAGLFAAALLGNLRDERQARLGLALVIGSGGRSSSTTTPGTRAGEYVFIPAVFALGWLAGFALRERSEQAEAAELRATQAERERDAAGRIAVAEERARIARELHDIVAHSVSVMVLQVGAVRHKLPEADAPQRDALSGVEQHGPHGARRDAPPARRDAQRRRRSRAGAAAGARQASTRCWTRSAARACRWRCTSRASRSRSRARSTSPRTGSSRRA